MSRRPESSPTGAAPARQNFNPLYRGGLWLAVMTTPGTSSLPDAKYSMSVAMSPRWTTSTPLLVAPSVNASARPGDDFLQSHPSRTCSVSTHSANAAPMRRAASSSSSSGTTPRTS